MLEDDDYRGSSQFRLWSFTSEQLREQREETNRFASERVRQAYSRAQQLNANGYDETTGVDTPPRSDSIDTLTVDEELRIVQWGCEKISEMRGVLDPSPSSEIVATAIQYLRRFYLLNSAMTYHPKQITVCAMWLALKSCHLYIPLHRFLSQLGNVTAEDVRAPEFLLMQALRFTLDVRHPLRSLRGGVTDIRVHASSISCLQSLSTDQVTRRVGKAADKANNLLKTNAQMTDTYFLYTPPQIWLAALFVSDEELANDYLNYLFSRLGPSIVGVRSNLSKAIEECASMIESYKSSSDDKATKQELGRIGKKLRKCQDPEKMDIVAVAKAKAAEKREGNESDGEKRAKKRKMGEEKKAKDEDVFGPGLGRVEN